MSRIEDRIEMFGIPNCDTIKKARKWLASEGIKYQFHDYKKEGVDRALLTEWCSAKGWEVLLNRRGTTWRKLPDDLKSSVDEIRAIALMVEHPSMIKRPVLVTGTQVEIGFSPDRYRELLGR